MRQNNVVREGLTTFDKIGHKDDIENKHKLGNLVYLGKEVESEVTGFRSTCDNCVKAPYVKRPSY